MVAAAMVGAAAVGAIGGGIASNSAANKQVGAANKATDLQGQMYQQGQENLSPYMGLGSQANNRLSDLMGTSGNTGASGYGSLTSSFTPSDYLANQDPGYQFQLQQGQQALQSSQAAQNGVLSGTALKDLMNFNQGVASTGYQNAFNRWQTQQGNTYQRLMGLSSLGENAAAGAGNMGVQSGANMAGTITGAGNAAAAGSIGVGNALNSGINNGMGYYYMSSMGGSGSAPPVTMGSDPNGFNGSMNNISAFVPT